MSKRRLRIASGCRKYRQPDSKNSDFTFAGKFDRTDWSLLLQDAHRFIQRVLKIIIHIMLEDFER